MDKYDFIKRLDNALQPLSEPERDSALRYYKELFEEAGSEHEYELIEHLGSPEKIAESIIRESGMLKCESVKSQENNSKNSSYEFKNSSNNSNNNTQDLKERFLELCHDKTFIIICIVAAVVIATSLEDLIIPVAAIVATVIVALAFI